MLVAAQSTTEMPSVPPLVDQIIGKVDQATQLYHRLLLVVGPAGAGKTTALRAVRDRLRVPLINVNLDLSRRLLELTAFQRKLRLPTILDDISDMGGIVLFDNTEILFDVALAADPLPLLQGLSRNRTVVATWNGSVTDGLLSYATPSHPEHQRYPARDLLVVHTAAEA